MTDTLVSSATKEVVIGFDRPFVMIGERINPTGRKLLACISRGTPGAASGFAARRSGRGTKTEVSTKLPMTSMSRSTPNTRWVSARRYSLTAVLGLTTTDDDDDARVGDH